ncbi:hypothetical protein [Ammoniphilus sp. 3BR4]|uniref:hypothetical protein n=1 Tax=Ammoniphilus sp. 3BR4 TaxID=3158265 RepID=UPI00346624FF
MNTLLILFVHGIILYFVVRSLRKQKKTKELLLFISLMLFSAYAGIAESASLPLPTFVVKGEDVIFRPIGKWIEQMLGGPFD